MSKISPYKKKISKVKFNKMKLKSSKDKKIIFPDFLKAILWRRTGRFAHSA